MEGESGGGTSAGPLDLRSRPREEQPLDLRVQRRRDQQPLDLSSSTRRAPPVSTASAASAPAPPSAPAAPSSSTGGPRRRRAQDLLQPYSVEDQAPGRRTRSATRSRPQPPPPPRASPPRPPPTPPVPAPRPSPQSFWRPVPLSPKGPSSVVAPSKARAVSTGRLRREVRDTWRPFSTEDHSQTRRTRSSTRQALDQPTSQLTSTPQPASKAQPRDIWRPTELSPQPPSTPTAIIARASPPPPSTSSQRRRRRQDSSSSLQPPAKRVAVSEASSETQRTLWQPQLNSAQPAPPATAQVPWRPFQSVSQAEPQAPPPVQEPPPPPPPPPPTTEAPSATPPPATRADSPAQPSTSTGLTQKGQKQRQRAFITMSKAKRQAFKERRKRRAAQKARRLELVRDRSNFHPKDWAKAWAAVGSDSSSSSDMGSVSSGDLGSDQDAAEDQAPPAPLPSPTPRPPSVMGMPPDPEWMPPAMPIKVEPQQVPTTLPQPRLQIPGFDPSSFYVLERLANRVVAKPGGQGYVNQVRFKVRLVKPMPNKDPFMWQFELQAILHHAFDSELRRATPNSIGQLWMENPNLHNGFQCSKRLPVEELSFQELAQRLAEAAQSGGLEGQKKVYFEDTTFLLVTSFRRRAGTIPKGLQSVTRTGISQWLHSCTGVWDPMSTRNRIDQDMDMMCVPLSIAAGRELCQNPNATVKKRQIFMRGEKIKEEARQLLTDAGLPVNRPCSVADVGKIQARMGDGWQITVWMSAKAPTASFGPNNAQHHINLFFHLLEEPVAAQDASPVDFHCFLIKDVRFLKGLGFWCDICKQGNKTTRAKYSHKCSDPSVLLCVQCQQVGCKNRCTSPQSEVFKTCQHCHFDFFDVQCYEHHLGDGCYKFTKCLDCGARLDRHSKKKHTCDLTFCQHCHRKHSTLARCFVQPPKLRGQTSRKGKTPGGEPEDNELDEVEEEEEAPPSGEAQEPKVWYADAETQVNPDTMNHKANLLVIQRLTGDPDAPLEEHRFEGPDCITDFAKVAMEPSSVFRSSFMVFHNGARFDCHLIASALTQLNATPQTTCKATSLIGMTLPNGLKFRDSLQFMPGVPLAAFPKLWGLEGSKGHFPHKLNVPRWCDASQPDLVYEEDGERFPKLHYFVMGSMRPAALAEVTAWHEEQRGAFAADPSLEYKPFRELVAYCQEDVRILRQGFTKYRANWRAQYPEMEPLEFLTFPSLNNALFRHRYMPKDSLALLPPLGYCMGNRRNSRLGEAWLAWKVHELESTGVKIVDLRTSRKGYEVRVGGLYVDGYAMDSNGHQHVWEFEGCWIHGCTSCIDWNKKKKQDRLAPFPDDEAEEVPTTKAKQWPTPAARRLRTHKKQTKLAELSKGGPWGEFTFECIWGHEFKEALKDPTSPMGQFANRYLMGYTREPLRPRDSFKGGRTNVIKHHIPKVKREEGWRLEYLDFTSLYPAVQWGTAGEVWPVGYPDIYLSSEVVDKAPKVQDSLGLWKCQVLPPPALRHPVLPLTLAGKLLFPLCRTCATESTPGRCQHTELQRALEGTWTSMELAKAIEKGYKILHTSEVWDWPPERRSATLFRDMITEQYGRKAMASKLPKDPAERADLLQHLAELGVKKPDGSPVAEEDFHHDETTRNLAKFSLNNIWGFLGKRSDVTELLITDDLEELWKREDDAKLEVKQVRILDKDDDGDKDLIMMSFKKLEDFAGRNGNIVVASMTTSYARLRLYEVLDEYADEVVYMDTDSVFLHLPPGRQGPPTSSRLGDLKNEILDKFGPDAFIVSFAAIAPKTYTFKVMNSAGETLLVEVKAKGVQLTAVAQETVTGELIAEMAAGEHEEGVRVPQEQIRRDPWDFFRLFNAFMNKSFRFSSSKRWILPDDPLRDSLPFGFAGPQAPLLPAQPPPHFDDPLDLLIYEMAQVIDSDEDL